MDIYKNRSKYWICFILLGIGIMLFCLADFEKNSTRAAYHTEVGNTAHTRVAKWDITGVTRKEGKQIDMSAGFAQNIITGTGNWFFEMENQSEVRAKINEKDSFVRFRLDHDSYSSKSKNTISWNFLNNEANQTIENPVTFRIMLYKGRIEDIVQYRHIENKMNVLSYEQYWALPNQDEQTNYQEEIKENIKGTEMFITSNQTFVKAQEIVNARQIYYYYTDINLTQLENDILDLGLAQPEQNVTIQVNWQVQADFIKDQTDVEKDSMYCRYQLYLDTIPTGYQRVDSYVINGKTYIIAQQELPFFEYQKYTSSLGGEPLFSFKDENSYLPDAKLLVRYSELTDLQRQTILSYQSAESVEDLQHLIEKYEYQQYTSFLLDQEKSLQVLTYLNYGLKCSIEFHFKVEQVD